MNTDETFFNHVLGLHDPEAKGINSARRVEAEKLPDTMDLRNREISFVLSSSSS